MRDRKNSALRDVRSLGAKNLTLMLQRDRADARVKALKEALELLTKDKEGLVLQAEQSKIKTRTEGHGRLYTDEFEAHAVKCMSTGISAQQCREQMLLNGAFHKAGEDFFVPEVDWFDRLWERIGNESLLYAFVKAARAKEAPQFGSRPRNRAGRRPVPALKSRAGAVLGGAPCPPCPTGRCSRRSARPALPYRALPLK